MAAPSILLPITVTGQQLVRWELPSGSATSRWPRVLQTPSHVVPESTEGKPAPPVFRQGLDPLPGHPAAPPSAPTSLGSPKGLCPREFIPRLVLIPHTLREKTLGLPISYPLPHLACECRERGREMKRKMGRHQPVCPHPLPHLLVPLAAVAARDGASDLAGHWPCTCTAPPHCPPNREPGPGGPGLLDHPLGSQGGAGER